MPRLDGTGPLGQGPMSGRGIGFLGRATGRGRRCCLNDYRNLAGKEEGKFLEEEARYLKAELEAIEKRKAELAKDK